ncbi:vacuolar membrane-associated protein iml1 [Elasticomyces elasticus]|nr:vacuolar membrane-associated protein iml1 [Elasticomyces elasticus]
MGSMGSEKTQKHIEVVCTLWLHDDGFSKEDVLIGPERVPDLPFELGSLAQIAAIEQNTAVVDHASGSNVEAHVSTVINEGVTVKTATAADSSDSKNVHVGADGLGGGRTAQHEKSYVFVMKGLNQDQRSKQPALQVSMHNSIAPVFGFRHRMQVVVTLVDKALYSANHVEITFRDQYLARADMWRMTISELSLKTVYKGQKINFMGTIKATVKNIYLHGKRVLSAYFSSHTKPIFRSESARYVVFLQMSREMWDFDAEGSGEIMFSKVINGFLPDLFKRWVKMNAHHLVSIIMFTRLEYPEGLISTDESTAHNLPRGDVDGQPADFRDYYRVVVSDMASSEWIRILDDLKREFKVFLRDVSIIRDPQSQTAQVSSLSNPSKNTIEAVIAGKPTTASRGNVLEAINLASSQFSKDYIDRDLVRTGISTIIITAGTGVYEVDYSMLKLTSDTLISNGIGIDLVALSHTPLHSVPLFKYRTPHVISNNLARQKSPDHGRSGMPHQNFRASSMTSTAPDVPMSLSSGDTYVVTKQLDELMTTATDDGWSYALPHWVDVSFWTGHASDQYDLTQTPTAGKTVKPSSKINGKHFVTRCRMYELQMMGLMENEMSNIAIPYLQEDSKALHAEIPQSRAAESSLSAESFVVGSFHSFELGGPQVPLDQHFAMSVPSEDARKVVKHPGLPKSKLWMESYDDDVFRAPEVSLPVEVKAQSDTAGYTSSIKPKGSRVDTGDSYGPAPSAYHKTGPSSKLVDIDGAFSKSTASVVRNTVPFNTRGKSTATTRQISLGPLRFGTVKGTASTSLSAEHVEHVSMGVRDIDERSSIRDIQNVDVSRQIRTSLARKSSQQSLATFTSDRIVEGKDARPTKPIAIKKAIQDNPKPAIRRQKTTDGNPDQTLQGENKIIVLDAATASIRSRPRLDDSLNESNANLPKTLSPLSALSPWLTLLNPSNPRKGNMNVASQFRRWQHVFPRPIRTSVIKWKSLCSPAALPLTHEYFPTAEQLKTEYDESPYTVAQHEEDDVAEIPKTRETLVRELIAFRLSHGFQIVIGSAVDEFAGTTNSDLGNVFDNNYMVHDGAMILMSVGHTIHQLLCVAGREVEVRRYNRKPSTAVRSSGLVDSSMVYTPFIRTALDPEYTMRKISFMPPRIEYNWNSIDNFLAGYQDNFSDVLRFWRARYVLIPVESPRPTRKPLPTVTEDSEEEIRLEGILKLTQSWQRHRYFTAEEKRRLGILRLRKGETNPLEIEYQTRDPTAVVDAFANGLAGFLSQNDPLAQYLGEAEVYSGKDYDMHRIAQHLQEEPPRGIKMEDRRWHWKLHYKCFRGDELTSWLLRNFKDVQNPDDAVALGNEFMQKGMITHVSEKHRFRDGHFLYQIAGEYRTTRYPDTASWFGKKSDRSVPPTPASDSPRNSPFPDKSRSRTSTADSSNSSECKTSTSRKDGGSSIDLSRVMKYDVDSRKRSYRPEIINLHYDRVHNPDNCYHIRIDWMNVTSKLIEDAIVNWATSIEKYGLKLVELPIAEACSIVEVHPFRAPYFVTLTLKPPDKHPPQYLDNASFTPDPRVDKFFYQKALLRHLNFVLDFEAASNFTSTVDVIYSWGKPDYKLTQFIHKSGVLLAEITNDGGFLLLANRLYNNRAAAAKDAGKFEKSEMVDRRGPSAIYGLHGGIDRPSPYSSPLVRAVAEVPINNTGRVGPERAFKTPEQIKDELEAFCSNPDALRAFYNVASKPTASPRHYITPVLDNNIPTLGLPPSISSRHPSPMS